MWLSGADINIAESLTAGNVAYYKYRSNLQVQTIVATLCAYVSFVSTMPGVLCCA